MTAAAASPTTRDRLLQAGIDLLTSGGPDAVSTRAVSAAAGVQPPAIYRLFGDKEGLLDAVATFGLRDYFLRKTELEVSDDPVADLRRAWDFHVDFGLSMPELYLLAFVPPGTKMRSASAESLTRLRVMVSRIAETGRLRMSVERASMLIRVSAVGGVCAQLPVPPRQRDPQLLAIARDNVLASILSDPPEQPTGSDLPSLAVALHQILARGAAPGFTPGEHALVTEWLQRLADTSG
jgi:AcrR family transcriptional regulator